MASNRRSSRGVATQQKKYKEVESDDEDAKLAIFDDSGSDFENDLKKKNGKVGSNRLKQDEPSSSSEYSSGKNCIVEKQNFKCRTFKQFLLMFISLPSYLLSLSITT